MKAILYPLTGLLFWLIPILSQANAVAVVDLSRAFDEYHRTRTLEQGLKTNADELKLKKDTLFSELEQIVAEFKKARETAESAIFTEEVQEKGRVLAEELLQRKRDKERQLKALEEDARRSIIEARREAEKQIVEDIRAVINEFARTNEILAVFDSSGPSATGVPTILYADERLDITDQIIAILNQGQPEPGPVPTPEPAP